MPADRTILHPPSREPRSSGRGISFPAPPPKWQISGKDTEGAGTSSFKSEPERGGRNPDPDSFPSSSLLLSRIAARDTDPEDLAEEFGIRLDLFLDWLRAPETVARLNALVDAREMNKQHARDVSRELMLDSLEAMHDRAKAEGDHVEQRRAATNFLRFSSYAAFGRARFGCVPGSARATDIRGSYAGGGVGASFGRGGVSRSRFPRSAPTNPFQPPAILSPPEQPSATDCPATATLKILHRLQDCDNPAPGDGLRTLHNHFTDKLRKLTRSTTADDFANTKLAAYLGLRGHHSAVLYPTQLQDGQRHGPHALSAVQQAEFIDLEGVKRRAILHFERNSPTDPWLINEFMLALPPAPNPHPSPGQPRSDSPPRPPPNPPPGPAP